MITPILGEGKAIFDWIAAQPDEGPMTEERCRNLAFADWCEFYRQTPRRPPFEE